jgi:FlaA1/EpsC-like NDP-sugar epimerase
VQGKCVLLAGVSDALGLELCRQVLHFSPHKLVIVEQYESYLTECIAHLRQAFPDACIVPWLCAPAGHTTLGNVFLEHRPHIVFHNAMCQYVPFFPCEGNHLARANALFTFALAQQAARTACEYFVFISSEAAAFRGNRMSDALRAAEIGLEQFFAGGKTGLVTVRLCDILENPGGTIARLREQITNRQPVLISRHAKCTFLTKQDAVLLILDTLAQTATGAIEKGIFVCTPGLATPLFEIAHTLAVLEGVQLGTDIPVQFLDEALPDGDASLEGHGRLEATSNKHISLLHPPLVPNTPLVTGALQALLHIEGQPLQHSAWEQFTRTLFRQGHLAES